MPPVLYKEKYRHWFKINIVFGTKDVPVQAVRPFDNIAIFSGGLKSPQKHFIDARTDQQNQISQYFWQVLE